MDGDRNVSPLVLSIQGNSVFIHVILYIVSER